MYLLTIVLYVPIDDLKFSPTPHAGTEFISRIIILLLNTLPLN
jgi:hypothetical protein